MRLSDAITRFSTQEDVAAGKPQRALEEAKILGRHEEQGRRVRRDGSIYWAHVTITPVHDEEGELRGFAKVVRDISESKRIEDELHAAKLSAEEAREDAEAANRAKDHFLAVLSHELRTPLTPALAVVSMLQENTRFDPDTRENLEVIRRNIDLEARLIEDLLDVSRIEQGKVELYRQTMALCTIINRAVEVCLPDIQARQLEFGVNNPDGPYLVDVDPARLQQVFWNLLKNAVKFTPHGGCVGIQCRRDGEHHVIAEVIDSGEGIHPDMLTRIFRPFEQEGRHITHQFGGLGLGLAISKAILDLHGGTDIRAQRGQGKSARFTVRLPISRTAPSLAAPSGSPEQAAAAATSASWLSCLSRTTVIQRGSWAASRPQRGMTSARPVMWPRRWISPGPASSICCSAIWVCPMAAVLTSWAQTAPPGQQSAGDCSFRIRSGGGYPAQQRGRLCCAFDQADESGAPH